MSTLKVNAVTNLAAETPYQPTLMTAVASTSGTSVDFSGIPSWVKRVTLQMSGVSASGTDNCIVQIGPSGGLEATGYAGSFCYLANAGSIVIGTHSTSFQVSVNNPSAACTLHGQVVLCLMDSSTNLWSMNSILGRGDGNLLYLSGGSKSLAGTLSKISVKWSGSNTFDAGSINVMYE